LGDGALAWERDRANQTEMNRYLLFTYYAGRPSGGMKDFLDSFESVAEALDNLLPEPTRYFQIVDQETLAIVKEGLALFKDYDAEMFSGDDEERGREPA
jgi:hypothetical protein